jgi:drug/metabolite transporter (DMT)-like permease
MIKYLTAYFPPLALVPIRLLLATALLVPLVAFREGFVIPPRIAWLPILGVALCSIFLHQITLTWGISKTSSTHAALILGLNPLFTSLFASYWAGEPFSFRKGLGILLGFGGVFLVVSGKEQGTATFLGDSVMFLATITFVLGALCVKKCAQYTSPLIITAYSHLIASTGLLIMGLLVNDTWISPGAIAPIPVAVLLFSSLVNTALGAVWWNTGIKKVGASVSSLFQNGIPVVGVFASVLFLGEPAFWTHWMALLLVVLGVSIGTGMLGTNIPTAHKQ